MNTQQLTKKEISIIEEISKNPQINQRTIAQNVGLSLGLTNLIIKKLVKTGFVKIKQLNRKKIEYILTPKGFAEKTKKTYNYILKTTEYFFNIYSKLKELILESIKNGKTHFYIYSTDEIYNLLEFIFHSLKIKNITYSRIYNLPQKFKNENTLYVIVDKTGKSINVKNIVNLANYLS
ncbi:MAG: winged helix-turn-helix transcriptional regulator [Elusimicrobiota bacterium]|nr:winged helix-turn-helix domain-containing protein [Endomicrobiia bacterium]MDW8166661.1 winged helix-turn-helix transcriptional regulator [Elusimicrobiota bacterium]